MFLADHQLKSLLENEPPLISGFWGEWSRLPAVDARWNTQSSPLQACSIDLHVGDILVPGTSPGKRGSLGAGLPAYSLKSGRSVVVSSHETLHLPTDIGGIALPPSRVSSKGILIANFGHVDPGYEGRMRFTVINMGKDDFPLVRGDDIITLLFFRVMPPDATWAARNPTRREIQQGEIDVLAEDFADIDQRARKIAREELGLSGYRYLLYNALVPMVLGAVVAAAVYLIQMWAFYDAKLDPISAAVTKLQAKEAAIESRLQRFETLQDTVDLLSARERDATSERLGAVESQLKALGRSP